MTFSVGITLGFLLLYYGSALWLLRGGIRLQARALCIGGLMIALTLVLDAIRIPLPTGATMSLCSPVPLLLLAILVDSRLAIVSGWVCGVLALFLSPAWQPVHWGQFFVEHMVCFSCLGFAGVFGSDRRWKILCGIVLASVIKFLGHLLSGVLFFSQNAWDGWGAWGYSLGYNLSQNLPLCILSGLIVLALPLQMLRRTVGKELNPL
ncbi:MAG TPA: energy-coupled thiamine transporter ThiT [Candidatus Onthomonas avicola]|nr:energy-coupled thiamine transporter ThiT [Candidatus Onthomonas avicola]